VAQGDPRNRMEDSAALNHVPQPAAGTDGGTDVARVAAIRLLSAPLIARHGRVDRSLLVAPPGPSAFIAPYRGFLPIGFDRAAVAQAAASSLVVASDNDLYCPEGRNGLRTTYLDPAGLRLHLVPGTGHISVDEGFGPWPQVLTWCTDPVDNGASLPRPALAEGGGLSCSVPTRASSLPSATNPERHRQLVSIGVSEPIRCACGGDNGWERGGEQSRCRPDSALVIIDSTSPVPVRRSALGQSVVEYPRPHGVP